MSIKDVSSTCVKVRIMPLIDSNQTLINMQKLFKWIAGSNVFTQNIISHRMLMNVEGSYEVIILSQHIHFHANICRNALIFGCLLSSKLVVQAEAAPMIVNVYCVKHYHAYMLLCLYSTLTHLKLFIDVVKLNEHQQILSWLFVKITQKLLKKLIFYRHLTHIINDNRYCNCLMCQECLNLQKIFDKKFREWGRLEMKIQCSHRLTEYHIITSCLSHLLSVHIE